MNSNECKKMLLGGKKIEYGIDDDCSTAVAIGVSQIAGCDNYCRKRLQRGELCPCDIFDNMPNARIWLRGGCGGCSNIIFPSASSINEATHLMGWNPHDGMEIFFEEETKRIGYNPMLLLITDEIRNLIKVEGSVRSYYIYAFFTVKQRYNHNSWGGTGDAYIVTNGHYEHPFKELKRSTLQNWRGVAGKWHYMTDSSLSLDAVCGPLVSVLNKERSWEKCRDIISEAVGKITLPMARP